jgi:hypothetical protein
MWTLANPQLRAAVICFVIAVVYIFMWPGRKDPERVRQLPFWRRLVLRWFHSLTWLLIASACLFWSKVPAIAACIVYLIFVWISRHRISTH